MRLLVVEDERRLANFISRALRENAYAVDVADSGEKALEMASFASYDGILLDIRLPGVTGIEVCRGLRRMENDIPILMLTARSLVEHRVEGLDAGADDYLTKPFALEELLARVRALLRRRLNSGGSVLTHADLELDRRRRRVARAGRSISLTAKEFAILEFLMLRAPEVVTRSEMIEHVWDTHFDSETNLVEVYINRLRNKISPEHTSKLIHTVHGMGYRLQSAE
jgi:two-component system copper resistance phosphate regulon response regulator CusR